MQLCVYFYYFKLQIGHFYYKLKFAIDTPYKIDMTKLKQGKMHKNTVPCLE